jgi:transposase-like protein
VLQKAVELEVTEFLGRDYYQRHGERLLRGYRNGYEDKRVETGAGPLHLKMPQVIDGNTGLRKAVRKCFPDAWMQRCQVHRMRNILCKLPEKARPGLKKLIQKTYTAQSYKAGLERAKAVVAMYQEQCPKR